MRVEIILSFLSFATIGLAIKPRLTSHKARFGAADVDFLGADLLGRVAARSLALAEHITIVARCIQG